MIQPTPKQEMTVHTQENQLQEGSALYRRALAFNGDPHLSALMQEVWQGTPWMVDAYTGSHDTNRYRELMAWCREQFGPEAWPLHGHPGQWHSGHATIHGWTWMGFATEAQLRLFCERWPAPPAASLEALTGYVRAIDAAVMP